MENNTNLNTPDEKVNENSFSTPVRKPGGLYRNVNVSVKTVNIVITVAIIVLFLCGWFVVTHNGFTVSFDTDGGSSIASSRVMHGETVPVAEIPVREGWTFTGWYLDRDCTVAWSMDSDVVTESMTLYAGWARADDTGDALK